MRSKESAPKPRAKTKPGEIVSMDEAVDLHRGAWIVMRVTSFDEKPLAGIVVEHSPRHSRLLKRVGPSLIDAKRQQAHYYIFLGEPRGRTGEDLRKQLEEIAAEEDKRYTRSS